MRGGRAAAGGRLPALLESGIQLEIEGDTLIDEGLRRRTEMDGSHLDL